MHINFDRFAALVGSLGAQILTAANPALTPIASLASHAMIEAEQIKGASGPEKADHVKRIVGAVVGSINTAKPGALNADAIDETLQEGIDTVIAAVKAAHGAAPIPASTPSPVPASAIQ